MQLLGESLIYWVKLFQRWIVAGKNEFWYRVVSILHIMNFYKRHKYAYIVHLYLHCQKIYNLFVWALETDRKVSLWWALLFCFTASEINIYLQTMFIVFILQCQKSTKQLSNCLKRAETSVVLIVFNNVVYHIHTYTFTVSYHRSTWIRYLNSYILVSHHI
jgi:hypothetical protein